MDDLVADEAALNKQIAAEGIVLLKNDTESIPHCFNKIFTNCPKSVILFCSEVFLFFNPLSWNFLCLNYTGRWFEFISARKGYSPSVIMSILHFHLSVLVFFSYCHIGGGRPPYDSDSSVESSLIRYLLASSFGFYFHR